ncbi:hypothetical protein [Phytoactinopolyspora mesophila]|uniref:Uncharacterized protein n=1 Tax=Phytoactinopolyspora mesophila TaxID=2650750 RepID=A0A7K3LYF5_9ACTN|nr:hypothetical protein [Phytoactinopolyspora mesophila]NDL55847.1 hypothetical protein [Phytoactinopolyspora mesophila]
MQDRAADPMDDASPEDVPVSGLVVMGDAGAGVCVDGVCSVPTARDGGS